MRSSKSLQTRVSVDTRTYEINSVFIALAPLSPSGLITKSCYSHTNA